MGRLKDVYSPAGGASPAYGREATNRRSFGTDFGAARRYRTLLLDTVLFAFLYSPPELPTWGTPMSKRLFFAFVIFVSAGVGSAQERGLLHPPKLTPQNSGTTQLLISVSPVNDRVVWAAGTGGAYTVTTDGGDTWTAGVVAEAAAAQEQFRDVYAVSDKIAYLMSIGNNANNFQIYKTLDGGATWNIEFTNQDPLAFYDCFAFWTPDRGITHSDSGNGVFPDIRTTDGVHWESIAANMPPALPGEASFAASGTCITAEGERNAWITTGASTIARILATRDGGNSWNAYDTPLLSSPSAGGISVAFRDSEHGIVGGGDLASNTSADAATSNDGGKTWTLTNKPPVQGAIFCLAYINGMRRDRHDVLDFLTERTVVITTETEPNYSSGEAAWTPDEGRTWFTMPNVSGYWAVAFASPHAGWFVGNNGQILKISF
jgi:photosystem II stability/assembly factor-like uncharacterized protein